MSENEKNTEVGYTTSASLLADTLHLNSLYPFYTKQRKLSLAAGGYTVVGGGIGSNYSKHLPNLRL